MSRWVTAVLAAMVATAGLVVVGGSVDGASAAGGCVSRSEYRRIHDGQSVSTVRAITGVSGKVTSRYSDGDYEYQSREYRTCGSRYGHAYVDFDNSDAVSDCVDAALDDYLNSDDVTYTEPYCGGYSPRVSSKYVYWG